MWIISKHHAIALAAVGAVLATASAAPARAETLTQVVSTADLNLGAPAGRATLRHRILTAARQVCVQGDDSDFYRLDLRECEHDAFQAAWEQAEERIAAARQGSLVASSK
jgi:UrcA family protein